MIDMTKVISGHHYQLSSEMPLSIGLFLEWYTIYVMYIYSISVMIVQRIPYSTFGGRRVNVGGAKPTLRGKIGQVPGGIKCC